MEYLDLGRCTSRFKIVSYVNLKLIQQVLRGYAKLILHFWSPMHTNFGHSAPLHDYGNCIAHKFFNTNFQHLQ
jgi:hypothetical protein